MSGISVKLIFMFWIIQDCFAVEPNGKSLMNAMTFKAINKIQCLFTDLLETVDRVSHNGWIAGDDNRKLPETEQGVIDYYEGFWTALSNPKLPETIKLHFRANAQGENLLTNFLENFNKSSIMELVKKNMDNSIKEFKSLNNNEHKIVGTRKKFYNVLIYAGRIDTTLTTGRFACYLKKWIDDILALVEENGHHIIRTACLPYLKLAEKLGTDSHCEWGDDILEAPDDLCYKSIDVLLLKGVVNLLRLKYLNKMFGDFN